MDLDLEVSPFHFDKLSNVKSRKIFLIGSEEEID
jgi:hypothetical protein